MIASESYLAVICSLIFVILVTLGLFFFLKTDSFLLFGLRLYRTYAGMQVRYVERMNGKGVWCYAEKGSHNRHRRHHHKHGKKNHYPTLVFLHGFGGDKDTWPSIVTKIPKTYHSIILDMPGHGETTFVEGLDEPTVESYVRSIREFLEVTHLDKEKIYLIGCSFGGAVAALFAHNYPECVLNLALLCPAIVTPVRTETCSKVMSGHFTTLIPTNGEEFINMISLLTSKTQYYPHRIMQSFVNINFTIERQSLLRKLLQNLVSKDKEFETDLQFKINSIKIPTLIIWGENDEMLHVSGAKLLADNLENCELQIIENCNHVLQLDQPKKTAKFIVDFVKDLSIRAF